jgi:hypothetical protein
MASTRNNNTPGNYCLQQKSYKEGRDYLAFTNSANGYAYDSKLPGNGLLAGQVPMPLLSDNSVDIESFLLGVNSTNLTENKDRIYSGTFVPELRNLASANLFEKDVIYLPEPLAIEKGQRPLRR